MTNDGEEKPDASASNRRTFARFDTWLQVDVANTDTFLFAYITNISEMGIFVRSDAPLPIGTELKLRFAPRDGGAPLELEGMVVWVNLLRLHGDNPNPGMGVRFDGLTADQRERVVGIVRTVAYLPHDTRRLD